MSFLTEIKAWRWPEAPAAIARGRQALRRRQPMAVERWIAGSLGRRFVLMSLGLLLVIQLTTVLVMQASMDRHARAALPEQLAMGVRNTLTVLDWRSQRLVDSARLLAADYGFRTAVASKDSDTIASVLSNHGARIGASEVALLSVDLKVLALAEDTPIESIDTGPDLARLASAATRSGASGGIVLVHGQPRQMVMVPLKAPVLMAWVLMYFPVGLSLAEQVHKLSVADLTLLTRANGNEPWRVAFSRLDPTASQVLAQLANETPLVDAPMTEVDVAGGLLGISAAYLPAVNDAAEAGRPQAMALLSVSVDAALRPPRDLQISLLLATLLGFVAFGAASAWTARRVTHPLESLALAVERFGAGEAGTPIVGLDGCDEVAELARAFEQMRSNLAAKQSQILQSEKLASIGQLAAGVAHEINNPIGFVFSNFNTLDGYLKQLFQMLSAYRAEESSIQDPGATRRLAALRESIELDYLAEDIPALMSESSEGIKRVRKIVQDLKDFSHVDAQREWQRVDLHVGLDSTLNIVNNELKYKADVVREYGELPEVECLPHEINQVFLNLLVNAAHAIGSSRGTITLRTGSTALEAWVEVTDNGCGIAPEVLKRIFDPFFTTKPVGKGTGLGLSLSYGIVKTHGGRIEVHTEVGRGTTFRVLLPLVAPPGR